MAEADLLTAPRTLLMIRMVDLVGTTAAGRTAGVRPDTGAVAAPSAPLLSAAVAVPPPAPTPGETVELFETLETFVQGIPGRLPSDRFPWDDLGALLQRIMDALDASSDLFWLATGRVAPPGIDYLAFHHTRVPVMAMRLAGNLGLERSERLALGIAGCLFDIGLWTDATRHGRSGATDDALYRAHPRRAADRVRAWSPPFESIVPAVLAHHEREGGQGYPAGTAGAAIDPHAKILGLIDEYTRMTVPPAWIPPKPPHQAVRDLLRSRHAFPPELIKALLTEVSVFPPGTMVRLSTGETARVVAVNRHQPLRPLVEMVADTKGHPVAVPRSMDLTETPFLYITGATGGRA